MEGSASASTPASADTPTVLEHLDREQASDWGTAAWKQGSWGPREAWVRSERPGNPERALECLGVPEPGGGRRKLTPAGSLPSGPWPVCLLLKVGKSAPFCRVTGRLYVHMRKVACLGPGM